MELSTTAGTTYVEICPAPPAGVTREIHFICIHNSDAGAETVTVSVDDSGTPHIQVVMATATTESLVWTPESGWQLTT